MMFTFIDTFENYEKERWDYKRNHIVKTKTLPKKWLKEIRERLREDLEYYGEIKIRRGYTKDYFVRELKDITIWKDITIFSW